MTKPKTKTRMKPHTGYQWDLGKIIFDKKCSCEHPVNEDSVCQICGLKSRRV